MKKKYRHLSAEERAVIMIEHAKGTSATAMARMLGRSPSTVTRELKRNGEEASACYDATRAALAYRVRREHCVRPRKLSAGSRLYQFVHDRLAYWRWSPHHLLPDFVGCTPTTPTNASATK